MRIVLINWAKIWDGASNGGGVNGYCQALAIALQQRGHDVISLVGGTTHVRQPAPPGRDCLIRRHDDWLGVRVFEVINSPVLAPSIQQFQDPLGEVSAPALEDQVGRLFDSLRPDVVHWHNIEGFSIGCVDRARASGARVVYSLHNYHTICPQVYLMQRHRDACFDFDNGHACTNCIQTNPVSTERELRIQGWLKHVAAAPSGPDADLRHAIAELRSGLSWVKRTARGISRLAAIAARRAFNPDPRHPDHLLPGHAADQPALVTAALPPLPADTRGQTKQLLAELHPAPEPDRSLPEYRPLLNILQPDPPIPPSTKAPNDYAKRRAAMIDMLNRCDQVLAVSDFVRRKFESMGVRPERIAAMPIGSRINNVVAHAHKLVFDPPPFDPAHPRPIRIVFMGYNHYYKGLGVFAETLETLAPEHMRQIDLSIYALDGQGIEWMFRRMEPRLARLTFMPGYQYHDIPWMLGGKDLGVVCSVWWDNAPQTVFEFQACGLPVLGAAVGGIPDFVHDNINGLLFHANDRADLARRLVEIIENPSVLTRLRANVRKPKDIDDHAAELERVYASPA